MSKDPSRYTPRQYGHAAPWNRQPSPSAPAPSSASVPARRPAKSSRFAGALARLLRPGHSTRG